MKISIVTVCYNSEETIEDTINSVLSQKYDNIEYIIIDGKSTDRTMSIIEKYSLRIDKVISEQDNGLYDAMNKGISMATGDVVGILNSDDIYTDDFSIEKVMDVFHRSTFLDAVYADLYYVSEKDTDKIVRRWITGVKKPFSKGWHPAHPSLILKKNVYTQFGYFNLNYKLAADFEIMLRFIEKSHIKIEYLKKPIIKMRLGGETNKSISNIISQNIECVREFKDNDLNVNSLL